VSGVGPQYHRYGAVWLVEDARMNQTIVKLAACIAWGGLAISSASPVSAYAASVNSGTYANCTMQSQIYSNSICGYNFNYMQFIRFVSMPCSSGFCDATVDGTFVETLYPAGRKPATPVTTCSSGTYWYLYSLDSCAC
jgi:hypothetical protein